jgi:hypothetical protein
VQQFLEFNPQTGQIIKRNAPAFLSNPFGKRRVSLLLEIHKVRICQRLLDLWQVGDMKILSLSASLSDSFFWSAAGSRKRQPCDRQQ